MQQMTGAGGLNLAIANRPAYGWITDSSTGGQLQYFTPSGAQMALKTDGTLDDTVAPGVTAVLPMSEVRNDTCPSQNAATTPPPWLDATFAPVVGQVVAVAGDMSVE